MGHKTQAMTLRYSHLSLGHQLDAVQRLATRPTATAAAVDAATEEPSTKPPKGIEPSTYRLRMALATVKLPLPLLDSLADTRTAFFGLCLEAGQEVLLTMMEKDRTQLCGPAPVPDPARRAYRLGRSRGKSRSAAGACGDVR